MRSKDDIARIKSGVDLIGIAEECGFKLIKKENVFTDGEFWFSPESKRWGIKGGSGSRDVFDLVCKYKGLSFSEAYEFLEGRIAPDSDLIEPEGTQRPPGWPEWTPPEDESCRPLRTH